MAYTADKVPESADLAATPSPEDVASLGPEGASNGGDADKKHTPRRRARRACLSCRARKVRCDVSIHGAPCGNCKWDNVECVVVSRRQGRYCRVNPLGKHTENCHWAEGAFPRTLPGSKAKPALQKVVFEETKPNVETSIIAAQQANDGQLQEVIEEVDSDTARLVTLLSAYNSSLSISVDSTPSAALVGDLRVHSTTVPNTPAANQDNEVVYLPRTTPHGRTPQSCMDIPKFIAPLVARIPKEDLAYLNTKGALTVPDIDLQNALLRSFFDYVYPFIPALDLDHFLQAVSTRDGSGGEISYLLFQAVMFAGTAHVDMDQLRKVGFRTRRQARKKFFERVRLLYDFNCESDRLTLVQALLLMTLWYETSAEHRNAWHWIDVAISQAFAAGLQNKCSPGTSPRETRLRRRVWWSCIMRDRLVSMAMRRPPRIRCDDISVEVLEDADFEPEPAVHPEDLTHMCSYANAGPTRRNLAQLCISLAQLCRYLRYQVPTHFSVFAENGVGGFAAAPVAASLLNPDKEANNSEFLTCHKSLALWYDALPAACRHHPIVKAVDDSEANVILHQAVLHMFFHAMQAGLYRSRYTSLLQAGDEAASLFDREMAKIRMQHAATQISETVGDLHNAGLDRLLPPGAITAVVAASVVHLLVVKGHVQADRMKALDGYRRCMRALQSLQDMYAAADVARDAMEWTFLGDCPNLVKDTSIALSASSTELSCEIQNTRTMSPSDMLMTTDATNELRHELEIESLDPDFYLWLN